MELHVLLAVLVAAVCHAAWNAMLKLDVEPIVAVSLISVGCGIVALPVLPFLPLPEPVSWPYVLASLALHLCYYLALAEAYRHGDLGQVYPIARGTAPLMTALGATALFGEILAPTAWAGIAVLSTGILILAFAGGRGLGRLDRRSVLFALLTSATISAYTLVDGQGARLSGSAIAYVAWLLLLDGIMMLAFGLWLRGGSFTLAARRNLTMTIAGGALSAIAYGTALWAMTLAPIALVAAARETSVLFATLIGILWLGEPVRYTRIAAVALAFTGVLLLRLA